MSGWRGVWQLRNDDGSVNSYRFTLAGDKLPASVMRVAGSRHKADGTSEKTDPFLLFPTTIGDRYAERPTMRTVLALTVVPIAASGHSKDQTGVGLAEAKQAVEAMQADAGPPSSSDIGGDLEAELLRLLGRGDKLEAVKLYKDQKGVSLLEAKRAVESLAASHGLVTQRAGCLGVVLAVVLAAVAFGMTIC
jgi:ribosomal protein L7/L12